jgi:DNA topoisomerase I
MDLIIVESPTKANTIKKFLGKDYKVLASFGHVRDLPKNELGVDVENNFTPRYIIPLKARKIISELKKEAKKIKSTILATDEDREGEAIAWHLAQILELDSPKRIVFHEITKSAIDNAIKNPRGIDMNLVDSQQARRILDRIVGYKLSPFLWKKIARGLSAGRVQSVTVRLVAEREKEIENFKKEEYWNIEATFNETPNPKTKEFSALLIKKNGEVIPKIGIKIKDEADKILDELKDAEYRVAKIEKKETKKNPLPPFTTSTLQQEAWKKLKYPAKFTMRIAQQLYENGHITYHRTDSLNLSESSLSIAEKFIKENYGNNYWPGFFKKYKAKGKAQEAHEAIRPAYPENTPEKMKSSIMASQYKLYELIWRRFIACQMSTAVFNSSAIEIETNNSNYTFKANGQTLKFDGFLKVYSMKFEEKELPELKEQEPLELKEITPSQHFTEPPPRYNEASLIKTLEENGIGRPSTYAPTISTIQERNYIAKDEQRRFRPTEIGNLVNDLLVRHFPVIVDIQFTAKMEEDLDEIAEGNKKWTDVCQEFYKPFNENLQKKYSEVSKEDITQKTDKICPQCGAELIIRFGRFGKFYACSGFPKCRHTAPLEEKELDMKCPKCQTGQIVAKRTKRGKIFYGCNKYPECDFALWDKPIKTEKGEIEKCPKCGSSLIEKGKQIKCSAKSCDFVKNELK